MAEEGSNKKGSDNKKLWNTLLFVLIIIVIFIDFFLLGFNRNKQTIGLVIILYAVYFVVYFVKSLFVDHEGDVHAVFKDLPLLGILTILQIGLPWLALEFVPKILPTATGLIFGVILMFSPWIIYYLFLTPEDIHGKLINTLKIIWVFILIGLIFLLTIPVLTNSLVNIASTTKVNVNPVVAITDFKGAIIDQINKIGNIFNSTKQSFLYNKKGEIDKNTNARLGVFIEDVRTIPENIIEDDSFFLLGKLKVNTLFNNIFITTNCYVKKNTNDKYPKSGIMEQDSYEVYGNNIELIECKLSGTDDGIYKTYFEAAFNFETWAYIDYTFVDRDLAMQFYREGKNINQELDIKQETFPIYTDGPMKIMMIAADQPVEVSYDENSNPNRYPKIGLSLEKNFLNGDIQKINEVIIQSPSMIKIVGCTFKGNFEALEEVPVGFEGGDLENYNYYRFYNNISNPDPEALRTIICNMDLPEGEYLKQKNVNSKIVKTIILKANYDYKVKSQEHSIFIKENPFN